MAQSVKEILQTTRTIALVGYSANADKPSHRVARFLKAQGYRVIAVNPGLAGQDFMGEPIVGSLAEIEGGVDLVDIFRRSEDIPPVVEAALAMEPLPKTIWMQLGIENASAAAAAEAKGLNVVQNKCPAIEIPMLFGGKSPLEA